MVSVDTGELEGLESCLVRRESAEICDSFTLSYSTRQAALNGDAASCGHARRSSQDFSDYKLGWSTARLPTPSRRWPRHRANSRRSSFARSFVSKPRQRYHTATCQESQGSPHDRRARQRRAAAAPILLRLVGARGDHERHGRRRARPVPALPGCGRK